MIIRSILAGLWLVILAGAATSDALDIHQKSELRNNPTVFVSVAIVSAPGAIYSLLADMPEGSSAFHYISTVLTRLPGEDLLALADDPRISEIEFIDDVLAREVYFLLGRLEQLHFYIRTGMHDVATLNLSLAPPRRLINNKPRRTGEATMRRSIEAFTLGLDLPVIMAIGNDGPAEGTANPWALAEGVIVVTAADWEGTRLWAQASKLGRDQDNIFVVSAWGINAITGRDTRYEVDLPVEPELVRLFGPDRAKLLRFVTGTSFAAPQVGRSLCGMHQMMFALRMMLSSVQGEQFLNPPYIRALVDKVIDRNAPQFYMRQVEKSRKFAGLSITLPEGHKKRLADSVRNLGLDLDLRITSTTAQRYLIHIARPLQAIPEEAPFISGEDVESRLAAYRLSDFISIFADPDDPRSSDWLATLALQGDPPILPPGLAKQIEAYCADYDLILALPLAQSD